MLTTTMSWIEWVGGLVIHRVRDSCSCSSLPPFLTSTSTVAGWIPATSTREWRIARTSIFMVC